MKLDFHCHTSISDGSLTPEALIDLAVEHQITTLAITDHDTTLSYELIKDYAAEKGVQLIAGSEISCQWNGHTIHIVGLEVDVENETLQNGLKYNRVLRWLRAFEIDAKFQKRAYNGVLEDILPEINVGMIGRNHFAHALIGRGLVKDQQQAFDKFLKKGQADVCRSRLAKLARSGAMDFGRRRHCRDRASAYL